MARRTKNDSQWQAVKKEVAVRDKNTCRLLSVISYRDYLILKATAPKNMLETLDPAHIFSVGAHHEETYNKDNIVTLNRFSHTCLDDMKSPITGDLISREERDDWWKLIAGKQWERIQHLSS